MLLGYILFMESEQRQRYQDRWEEESRQTKAEMVRPGERGHGMMPGDRQYWHVIIRVGTLEGGGKNQIMQLLGTK